MQEILHKEHGDTFMRRLIWWLFIVALLVAGAGWLTQQPGHVLISWKNKEILFPSVAGFAGIIGVAFCIFYLIISIISFIIDLPRRMQRNSMINRTRKGIKSMLQCETLSALEDWEALQSQASSLGHLLDNPTIGSGLLIKAALMNNDMEEVDRQLEILKSTPDGQNLASIWQVRVAIKRKEYTSAYAVLKDLLKQFPKSPWACNTYIDVCEKLGKYKEAIEALAKMIRRNAISGVDANQKQSALYYKLAHKKGASMSISEKIKLLDQAHTLNQSDVTTSVELAKLLHVDNSAKRAERVLTRTWQLNPSEEIADTYIDIQPSVSSEDILTRIEDLHSLTPKHPISLLIYAKSAISASQWGKAHVALNQLRDGPGLNAHGCRLMAQLELEEKGDITSYREWLEKAAKSAA